MSKRGNRTLLRISVLSILLVAVGTFGFARFEHYNYALSLYTTLLVLLTHYPHGDVATWQGKTLLIFLIIASLVIIAYLLKWFAEYMIGIGGNVRKRHVKAKIDKLKGHYIVCGLGRVGSQVAREMAIEGIAFVGIDKDQERVDEALESGYLAFCADSSAEGTLLDAGISRAKGLVASLGEDSLNLFVTLAAKSLNGKVYVVARANRQESELKLKRAGADRVALPYQIGGYHMASMVLRPNVVDYLDVINTNGSNKDLQVEEMIVGDKSELAGHRLAEHKFLVEGSNGATVIAINGSDGSSIVRPSGSEVIYPGDRLILLGAKKDLTEASALIR
ncbi:MAG TPA: TrkA family potassium uptake protein [Candidatus Saccharimonadales bacterium]|nr:TrkA family potassium uptake protein [Candidatus Saccharimonadales bacterium]